MILGPLQTWKLFLVQEPAYQSTPANREKMKAAMADKEYTVANLVAAYNTFKGK